ncbi:YhdP family phospholipid transporter [Marinomonas dokdonensis]|uniref:YhdP family phospholipid transporter n=1 Tax=Marinomonas dokdonensis TaxID=328224 RepID=UPI0040554E83
MMLLLRKLIIVIFWLAVVFTATLAMLTYGIKHALPYLDYYRPQIENNLSQITGYPVTLKRIDGQLEGLDPTVSVEGLLIENNGQTLVSIDELRVRLDSIKSLLTLKPQFTYVRFVKPVVALQERQGQWQLKGALSKQSDNAGVGAERVLGYLATQKYLSILNATIQIDSEELGTHAINIPEGDIFQQQNQSLLTAEMYLDDNPEAFTIDAKLSSSLSLFDDYRMQMALHLPKTPLPSSLSLFEQVPTLAEVQLGGDLWLDFLVGKDVSIQLESSQLDLAFKNGDEYSLSPSIKAKYSAKKPHIRVDVNNVLLTDQATNISFDWSSTSGRSTLKFDQIDMAAANRIGLQFLQPEWTATDILSGLSPHGTAKNASLTIWKETEEWAFQYLSNLQDASISGYLGIPQANKIDAIFSLSDRDGYIDLQGKESVIAFDTLYDEAWPTEKLKGHVAWQQQGDYFIVNGSDLYLKRNQAEVNGGFRLEIKPEANDWFALDLNSKNLDLEDRLTYLPKGALDDDIVDWIDTAFKSPGKVPNLDLMVHSELVEGSSPHVRLQIEAKDLQIAFDPNWPKAEQVTGKFDLDQQGIHINVSSAKMRDLKVQNIALSVPFVKDGVTWMNIKGHVKDQAPVILDHLQHTPLAEDILSPFEEWQIQGEIAGDLDISVPFSEDVSPRVKLALDFAKNDVYLGELDLATTVQAGRFNYDSSQGIYDSTFDVSTLGGISQLTLSSNSADDETLVIEGDLSGQVDVSSVANWSIVPFPELIAQKLTGKVSYQGQLAINKSQQDQFDMSITSDLVGANIDFPTPIGKSADQPVNYSFKLMQHNDDMVIDDDFGGLVRSRLLLRDSELVGGEVLLNKDQSFNSNIPNGLKVIGQVKYLDISAWQEIVDAFIAYHEEGEAVTDQEASILDIPEWLSQMDIIIDALVINEDNTLHNAKLGYPINQGLRFSSDEMNFELTQKDYGPDLHFDFLSWNLSKEDTEEGDNEPFVRSAQIPNMTLSIDQLYIDNSPYGDWSTKIQREGNRVRLTSISSELKTGEFDGSLFWQDQEDRSNVELTLGVKGKDLAELTQKFSDKPFVTSKNYDINVVLSWQGHPFHFDRPSLSGRIGFAADNGSFTQIEELPAFLKVLGIFNVGALSRRLSLDFTDVYEPGLSYDSFTGDMVIYKGLLTTTKPVTIISPTAELFVEGSANIVEETLNERMTASFPISGTLPLAGLLWGTPQIAGLLFITDRLFGSQISKVTSVRYDVTGTFDNPVMTQVKYQPTQSKKRND